MQYYPITLGEIAAGAVRPYKDGADPHAGEIPVRRPYTLPHGTTIPMLSWGHRSAYEIIRHNGKLYAVYRYEDAENREFLD